MDSKESEDHQSPAESPQTDPRSDRRGTPPWG